MPRLRLLFLLLTSVVGVFDDIVLMVVALVGEAVVVVAVFGEVLVVVAVIG